MRRALLLPYLLTTVLTALNALCAAGASEVPVRLGPAPAPTPLSLPAVACPVPTSPLERSLWEVVTHGGTWPDLSCGNAFTGYLATPRDLAHPLDGFEAIAQGIEQARSEVLLTNMEWQAGPGHPGWTFAQAVARLYARVKASPQAYPDGLRVRLLLGGFPDLRRPDGASQPIAAARDLLTLGVPLRDDDRRWSVSILNYRYFPHSHVKLQVIDGESLGVQGFNFVDAHLPAAEPGGTNLHDLGLQLRGPVAQQGVWAFDDLWRHSQQLRCPDDVTAEALERRCRMDTADPVSHPDVARVPRLAGTSRAFLLYRRSAGEDQADRATLALLDAARSNLDLMQADFGPMPYCWFAFLNPETCGVPTWPVYLTAVLRAAERGVHVRVLLVPYGFGANANRSGVALLRRELRRRGLQDRFEARYTDFQMHTKALSVDRQVVVVGSMNFHFSSWGSLGLAEASVATSDPQAVQEQAQRFDEAWRTSSRPVPDEAWLPSIPQADAALPEAGQAHGAPAGAELH